MGLARSAAAPDMDVPAAPSSERSAADQSSSTDADAPRNALRAMMDAARARWSSSAAPPLQADSATDRMPPRDAFQAMMKSAAARTGASSSAAQPAGATSAGSAAAAQHSRRGGGRAWGASGGGRLAPFKRVEGTRVVVDGFTAAPSDSLIYVLSHFHADHYVGMTRKWSVPVYCSSVTARLVTRQLGLSPHLLRTLPLDTATLLPDGVRVTAMDANHCPGAVILLFELPDGRRALHTGDFRYLPSMALNAALHALPLDLLYLDTTYVGQAAL